MKIKKTYLLIVLFLCGLSVGTVFAAASAAAAAEKAVAPVAGYLEEKLKAAAKEGNKKEVERLIASGADVNATVFGWTPLMWATLYNNAKIVTLLLQAGADVNDTTSLGDTALMFAAIKGYADIVKLLLDAGADKNIKNRRGKTATDLAQRYGHKKLANMIKDYVSSGRFTKPARLDF